MENINVNAILWLVATIALFINMFFFGDTIITWGHSTEYHPFVVIVLSVIGMYASSKLSDYYARLC